MLAAHTLARSHPNASDRWIQDNDGGVKRCCETPCKCLDAQLSLSHPRSISRQRCSSLAAAAPSQRATLPRCDSPLAQLSVVAAVADSYIDLLYRKGWSGFWSPGRFRGGGEGWALRRVCGCGATSALITRTQCVLTARICAMFIITLRNATSCDKIMSIHHTCAFDPRACGAAVRIRSHRRRIRTFVCPLSSAAVMDGFLCLLILASYESS